MACRSRSTIVNSESVTLSISSDGNVYGCYGQHGHEEHDVFPLKMISSLKNINSIALGEAHSVCLDYDGNVYTFGDNRKGQLGVGVERNSLSHTHTPQKVNLPPCKQIVVKIIPYVYVKMD